MRKPTNLVLTRSDTNRAVQSQKMVRGWKFWFQKEEELYYLYNKNKGPDQINVSQLGAFSSVLLNEKSKTPYPRALGQWFQMTRAQYTEIVQQLL